MAAQLLQTVDPALPVVRWSARIAVTAIAALALADCGGDECGAPSAFCQSPPMGETVLGVAVADLNGDGHPDVAIPLSTGGAEPGGVGVYQHVSMSGKGYAPRVDYATSTDPYTVLAFDLNGDGRPDLLTSDYRFAAIAVLLNSATDPGTFGAAQILPALDVSRVAVADMNGDGLPDLVAAARHLLLSLQDIGAPGTFAPPTTLFTNPSSKQFRSSALSDLNGDGAPDVVVAADDGVSVLFTTPSTATPTIASTTTIYTSARSGEFPSVAVADVNGDGRDDLAVADPGGGSVAVLQQSDAVAGQFLPAATFSLPAGAGLSVVVADLNGDGYADIVSGGSAIVAVLLQDATRPGTFPESSTYGAPIAANAVAVADIDGDGMLDIVTNSGVTSTVDSGLLRTPPGVLYQDPGRPGSFLAMQNLG